MAGHEDQEAVGDLPPRSTKSVRASELAARLEARRAAGLRRSYEVRQLLKKASEADLCFLCDATGSMQGPINKVKDEIAAMVDLIKKDMPTCTLRVAFVGYRDYGDTQPVEVLPFTSDIAGFKRFVGGVTAIGGGDAAEDVFSGLEAAQGLEWGAGSRILVHVADAPCHGYPDFHDMGTNPKYDSHSGGDKLGRDPAQLLKTFVDSCKLDAWVFCHLTSYTAKMLGKFKALLGEQYAGLVQEHDDGGRLSTIPLSTVQATSSSLSQSRATGSHRYQFEPQTVDAVEPNMSSQAARPAMVHRYRTVADVDSMLTNISAYRKLAPIESTKSTVWVAPRPFTTEGAMKWPHYSFCEGAYADGDVIAKRLKTPILHGTGSDFHSFHRVLRYAAHMESAAVAGVMAQEFNKRVAEVLPGAGKVSYLRVYIAEVMNGASKELYLLEARLRDEPWTRFGNNAGWVNQHEPAELAHAFSHWTHARSQGRLMVTDLQGCRDGQGYQLSDPAVHCIDMMRFAGGNLGQAGMQNFLDTHTCGPTCAALGLAPSSAKTLADSAAASSESVSLANYLDDWHIVEE